MKLFTLLALTILSTLGHASPSAPSSLLSHPALSSIDTLLFSSALEEYGSDEVWKAALDHEWLTMEGADEERRRTTEGALNSGFILCSAAASATGSPLNGHARASLVASSVGITADQLRPMHNKDDRTCWRAWMTADQARDCAADSHPELTIHPVSHAVRLPPNFLRSTVGFTSEDESPVGRTAPMLTLDLCPTAAAGELVAFAKRVEGELYDLFAAVPDAGDAAEASHARHTDSFFWTSQAAEPHKTGAPHTTRYSDALAFTASDEGKAACANALRHLTFDSSSTAANDVHIGNVNTFYDAVVAAHSSAHADACFLTLATYIATAVPELCALHPRGAMELKNTAAQWIVQSGDSTGDGKRPFWDAGLKGEGQIVAVTDTGLAEDNCYFRDATGMVTPANDATSFDLSKRKVVQYYNWVDALDEEGGHGTHVCGSIVGHKSTAGTKEGESTGYADGVAKNAKVAFFDLGLGQNLFGSPEGALSTTQCPNEGGCLWTPGNIPLFLDPGYNAGARLHSASWGDMTGDLVDGYRDSNTYKYMDASFDEYMHTHDDFLLLVAAGNDGEFDGPDTPNTVGSPSTSKNCVSVGASNNLGNAASNFGGKDSLAMFSSRGPSADGRMKPDLVSPGFFILSAAARNGQTGECDPATPPSNGGPDDSGVTYMAGTSMATPVTSGAAALVRQYFMEGFYPTGSAVNANKMSSPSGALIKAVLMNSAQAISTVPTGTGTTVTTVTNVYDNNQGFGLTSLDKALKLTGNPIDAFVVDREELATGGNYDIRITTNTCSASSELSVTLAYTDFAGTPNCKSGCMVNDLDLLVTKDGSGKIYPNGRTTRDSVNNVERVRVDTEAGDVFTVNVHGRNIGGSAPKQKFSLVVSGCFTVVTDVVTNVPTAAPTFAPSPPTPSPTNAPVTSSPTQAPTWMMYDTFCELYVEYKGLQLTSHGASIADLNGDTDMARHFRGAVAHVAGDNTDGDSFVCHSDARIAVLAEDQGEPTTRHLAEGYVTMDVNFHVSIHLTDLEECTDPTKMNLALTSVKQNLQNAVTGNGLRDALRAAASGDSWLKTVDVAEEGFDIVKDAQGNDATTKNSTLENRYCVRTCAMLAAGVVSECGAGQASCSYGCQTAVDDMVSGCERGDAFTSGETYDVYKSVSYTLLNAPTCTIDFQSCEHAFMSIFFGIYWDSPFGWCAGAREACSDDCKGVVTRLLDGETCRAGDLVIRAENSGGGGDMMFDPVIAKQDVIDNIPTCLPAAGVPTQAPSPAPRCDDGEMNGDETAVDCGGPVCPGCDIGGDGNPRPTPRPTPSPTRHPIAGDDDTAGGDECLDAIAALSSGMPAVPEVPGVRVGVGVCASTFASVESACDTDCQSAIDSVTSKCTVSAVPSDQTALIGLLLSLPSLTTTCTIPPLPPIAAACQPARAVVMEGMGMAGQDEGSIPTGECSQLGGDDPDAECPASCQMAIDAIFDTCRQDDRRLVDEAALTCNTGVQYIATGDTCSVEIKAIVAEKNSHMASVGWVEGAACAAHQDACVQNVAEYSCDGEDGLKCEIAEGCKVTYNMGFCLASCEVNDEAPLPRWQGCDVSNTGNNAQPSLSGSTCECAVKDEDWVPDDYMSYDDDYGPEGGAPFDPIAFALRLSKMTNTCVIPDVIPDVPDVVQSCANIIKKISAGFGPNPSGPCAGVGDGSCSAGCWDLVDDLMESKNCMLGAKTVAEAQIKKFAPSCLEEEGEETPDDPTSEAPTMAPIRIIVKAAVEIVGMTEDKWKESGETAFKKGVSKAVGCREDDVRIVSAIATAGRRLGIGGIDVVFEVDVTTVVAERESAGEAKTALVEELVTDVGEALQGEELVAEMEAATGLELGEIVTTEEPKGVEKELLAMVDVWEQGEGHRHFWACYEDFEGDNFEALENCAVVYGPAVVFMLGVLGLCLGCCVKSCSKQERSNRKAKMLMHAHSQRSGREFEMPNMRDSSMSSAGFQGVNPMASSAGRGPPPPGRKMRQRGVSVWEECMDESSGYPYYVNGETGETSWNAPVGWKGGMV